MDRDWSVEICDINEYTKENNEIFISILNKMSWETIDFCLDFPSKPGDIYSYCKYQEIADLSNLNKLLDIRKDIKNIRLITQSPKALSRILSQIKDFPMINFEINCTPIDYILNTNKDLKNLNINLYSVGKNYLSKINKIIQYEVIYPNQEVSNSALLAGTKFVVDKSGRWDEKSYVLFNKQFREVVEFLLNRGKIWKEYEFWMYATNREPRITIRHDLMVIPHSRLNYPIAELGNLETLEGKNVDLMMGLYLSELGKSAQCNSCPIRDVCCNGCLGSQYEQTGDLFTAIPNQCKLEHLKIKILYDIYRNNKIEGSEKYIQMGETIEYR